VRVILGGETIIDTTRALRVLETSHPPTFYLPREDVLEGALAPASGASFCEWKGHASYLDLVGGGVTAARAAWFYPDPAPAMAVLDGHISLYPGRVDACLVDDERVRPQDGGFYGGWITEEIVGPFKGAPHTRGW